jgi:hypothetical protein
MTNTNTKHVRLTKTKLKGKKKYYLCASACVHIIIKPYLFGRLKDSFVK